MKKILTLTVMSLVAGCMAATAQTIAIQDLVPKDAATPATYGGTVGFEFTLSSNATLDSLGVLDADTAASNGGSGIVGLFSADGTELASATIAIPSDQAANTYKFTSSLTYFNGFTGAISADTNYYIGSVGGGGHGGIPYYNDSDNTFTPGSGLDVVYSTFSQDFGLSAPKVRDGSTNAGQGYAGPNFTYTVVAPEPSIDALILVGLVMLAGIVHLRSRKA